MKVKEKEILSSCCAFGSEGTEAVHVLSSECPINREEGKRIVQPIFNHEIERTECTCVCVSGLDGVVTPPCQHYTGIKEVSRDKRKKYKVLFSAIKVDESSNQSNEKNSEVGNGSMLKIGDTIRRDKDGQIMKVVPDDQAVLYVDNEKIGITDASFYLDVGAIQKV